MYFTSGNQFIQEIAGRWRLDTLESTSLPALLLRFPVSNQPKPTGLPTQPGSNHEFARRMYA
jgi:hypothetical protein